MTAVPGTIFDRIQHNILFVVPCCDVLQKVVMIYHISVCIILNVDTSK